MSPAETALRTALHNDARTHLGRMFGIAANAPKPVQAPAPVVPANAALPLKG